VKNWFFKVWVFKFNLYRYAVGEDSGGAGQLLKLFKLLRLFRLMKLLRLFKIMVRPPCELTRGSL
jgi:hypothetical protein